MWLYHRFTLSFKDIEDLLAEQGVIVTYEFDSGCMKFGPNYVNQLRKRQGRLRDTWLMDEAVIVTVQGGATARTPSGCASLINVVSR